MPKRRSPKSIDRWIARNRNKHKCLCGCGEYIEVKRKHARASVGIPKFIQGHNINISKEELEEKEKEYEEAKNPWNSLTEEEKEDRLSKLSTFKSGEDNPAYKGGRRQDEAGYWQILLPEHPFSRGGYVAEHRLVVEEWHRENEPENPYLIEIDGEKYLHPKSVVHHVDEVKTNNDISNLMLLENQNAHSFIHYSPLPMEERLRRIKLRIYHSNPLD